jgi:hypothetical protein
MRPSGNSLASVGIARVTLAAFAGSPSAAGGRDAATMAGIVVSKHMAAGERVSGFLVTDPDDYSAIPGLRVFRRRIKLPRDAAGVPSLEGVTVSARGEQPRQASAGFSFTAPEIASEVPVIVTVAGGETARQR